MNNIREFNQEALRIKDCILLTMGDPFECCDHSIIQQTKESLDSQETHYSSILGLESLREKIKENHNEYEMDEICITTGATEGLFSTLVSCFHVDDEIIVLSPYYPAYIEQIELCHLKYRIVELEKSYQINKDKIVDAINTHTKGMIINHPHNPTGTCLNKQSIDSLKQIIQEYQLLCIWDATYYHQNLTLFDEEIKKNLIQIYSFSKNYKMCGFRLGYLLCDQIIMAKIKKAHQLIQVSVPEFVQRAGEQALNNQIADYSKQKNNVITLLNEAYIPCLNTPCSYYIYLKIPCLSESFVRDLLREEHVAVLPGKYFNDEFTIRISCCGAEEKLYEGIKRIIRFWKTI